MRVHFLTNLLLVAIISFPTSILFSQTKERKIILWQYDRDNSRESYIMNITELNMSHSKIADSVYSTKIRDKRGQGYYNIDIRIDLLNKKASYIQDNLISSIDDNRIQPVIRDTFRIKYIDNKFFRVTDYKKKYFVYRFLIYCNNIEGSEDLIYWSKDFGIILEKSLQSDYLFRVEYINDNESNEIMNHICFLIFGDKYFNQLDDWKKFKN